MHPGEGEGDRPRIRVFGPWARTALRSGGVGEQQGPELLTGLAGLGLGLLEAVSYTHLTLPTNREV